MHTYQIDALIHWAGTLAVLVFLVAVAYLWARRVADQRHELRLKMLERFSAPELAAILETPEGRTWMADILTGRCDPSAAAGESYRRTVFLLIVGLGLGFAGAVEHARLLGIAGALALLGAFADAVASFVATRRRKNLPADGRA